MVREKVRGFIRGPGQVLILKALKKKFRGSCGGLQRSAFEVRAIATDLPDHPHRRPRPANERLIEGLGFLGDRVDGFDVVLDERRESFHREAHPRGVACAVVRGHDEAVQPFVIRHDFQTLLDRVERRLILRALNLLGTEVAREVGDLGFDRTRQPLKGEPGPVELLEGTPAGEIERRVPGVSLFIGCERPKVCPVG